MFCKSLLHCKALSPGKLNQRRIMLNPVTLYRKFL